MKISFIIIAVLSFLFTVHTILNAKIEGGLAKHLIGFIKYLVIVSIAALLTRLWERAFKVDDESYYSFIVFILIYALLEGLFYIIKKGVLAIYKDNPNNE